MCQSGTETLLSATHHQNLDRWFRDDDVPDVVLFREILQISPVRRVFHIQVICGVFHIKFGADITSAR
jgi:hypothetical protein